MFNMDAVLACTGFFCFWLSCSLLYCKRYFRVKKLFPSN